ncbi:MAG: hypothetical protein ACRD3B_01655 [Candidatus Sulfotelmatobacter sp.]
MAEMPLSPGAESKKKHSWLPVLVVLFLISYALMTMLIIEQGRTIDSQRARIHELFRDSQELSAAKQKAPEEQAQVAQSQNAVAPDPSSQGSSKQSRSMQAPSTQTPSHVAPSTQAPVKQAPSTQANPQHHAQTEAAKQKPFKMPSKPASDLLDADRSLNLI